MKKSILLLLVVLMSVGLLQGLASASPSGAASLPSVQHNGIASKAWFTRIDVTTKWIQLYGKTSVTNVSRTKKFVECRVTAWAGLHYLDSSIRNQVMKSGEHYAFWWSLEGPNTHQAHSEDIAGRNNCRSVKVFGS